MKRFRVTKLLLSYLLGSYAFWLFGLPFWFQTIRSFNQLEHLFLGVVVILSPITKVDATLAFTLLGTLGGVIVGSVRELLQRSSATSIVNNPPCDRVRLRQIAVNLNQTVNTRRIEQHAWPFLVRASATSCPSQREHRVKHWLQFPAHVLAW